MLITSSMRDALTDQTIDGLEDKARLVAHVLDHDGDLQVQVSEIAPEAAVRITVIEEDGTVIADSSFDPTLMENHGRRPEVVQALEGAVGTHRRVSDTTGVAQLYVAILDDSPRIVRLSVTEAQIAADLREIGGRILLIAVVVGAFGVAVVGLVASRTTKPIAELTDVADRVAAGELSLQPGSSKIAEVDRLGKAVGRMSSELGSRILEAESERHTLEVVLSALLQGVVLFEEDDAVLYANPAATRLLGPVSGHLSGIAPHAVQRLVREARRQRVPADEMAEHGAPARTLQITATAFDRDDPRVLVVISDVTDELRTAQIRRDFVADASHELKTPAASILASVEALQLALNHNPDRVPGFATQVERSARQLVRIVADLLDLSRLESSDLAFEVVRLDEVTLEEVERLRERALEAGVELRVDCEPVQVHGSENDLGLAVRNLCDNALRYTDAGGSVSVGVRPEDGRAVVEVRDTGTGIPKRAIGRVFERFFRVDDARSRATGGTGLGLAIVKHVAERHGGGVTVQSDLGVGSVFRLTIPRSANGAETAIL